MTAAPPALRLRSTGRTGSGFAAIRRLVEDPAHRVVASFGGGSLPGLAGNLAFAAVLDELGLRQHLDQVWGTSAGAIVGAGLAAGRSAEEMLQAVEQAGQHHRPDFRAAIGRLLLALVLRRPLPDGVLSLAGFARAIEAGVGAATFEQCPIPFRCVACADDGHGTRHVFRRGPLLPAVLASMNLPGIFALPRWLDERHRQCWDGGMVEKTPLLSPIAEHDRSGDGRTLVILATRFGPRWKGMRPRGFVHRFLRGIDVLEDRLWEYQLLEARARRDVRVLLVEPPNEGGMLDFSHLRPRFDTARDSLRSDLTDAKLALAFAAT